MRIFRYMALALALMIVLAAAAWQQQQTSEAVTCGNTSGGVSRVFNGVQNARAAGQWMHRWATADAPSNEAVTAWVNGVGSVLGAWAGTFVAEATGQPVPAEVEAIEARHAAALQAAEDACTPCPTGAPVQPREDGQAPTAEPEWDPKNAALKGPELTADALRKAGFPSGEIPTFMAIAEYESTHNPNAWNDYGMGMAGLFQLNQEHWQLKNWRNPYANARMAKRVRDESVEAGNGPYHPWSVRKTAAANAHRYAKYGEPAGVGAGAGADTAEPPSEFCLPSAEAEVTGGLGLTAGTWNVLYTNSAGNVNRNAGFADVVGLQEIRDKHRPLNVPGYAAIGGAAAVPIIYRTDRLELVKSRSMPKGWDREATLKGSVHKWAVYAVFRNRASGVKFAVVNTHQYVNGGPKWREQARNVDKITKRLRARKLPVILLGDMNATENVVAAWFGASYGGGIDKVVPYGLRKPSKTVRLGKAGSDHRRILATFPAAKAASSAAAIGKGGGSIPADFDRQGNPRTAAEAVAWMTTAAKRDGMNGEQVSNRCERYMNLAYGLSGGYPTARAHWEAAGPKGQGVPPRGALVFWDTRNSAGHVAMSVGNGRVISTDYDARTGRFRTGSIDEGPITDIDKWGKRLGWRAPNFKVGSGA